MQSFFLSYQISLPASRQFRHYSISYTNNPKEIIRAILKRYHCVGRPELGDALAEFDQTGVVHMGRGDSVMSVSQIQIKLLPESDLKILEKYLWTNPTA